MSDGAEEASRVEPVGPSEGCQLDGLEGAPWAAPLDQFGLEETDHALGERIIIGVADAADRGLDACFGEALLERMTDAVVLHGDKGYDSNAIRRQVEAKGALPNIPPKANRRWKLVFSPVLYRDRNAIERMFRRLKDCRRIATRYDRKATNVLAADFSTVVRRGTWDSNSKHRSWRCHRARIGFRFDLGAD